jgi:hypothetical protein
MKLQEIKKHEIVKFDITKARPGTRRLKRYTMNSMSNNDGTVVRCNLIKIYKTS